MKNTCQTHKTHFSIAIKRFLTPFQWIFNYANRADVILIDNTAASRPYDKHNRGTWIRPLYTDQSQVCLIWIHNKDFWRHTRVLKCAPGLYKVLYGKSNQKTTKVGVPPLLSLLWGVGHEVAESNYYGCVFKFVYLCIRAFHKFLVPSPPAWFSVIGRSRRVGRIRLKWKRLNRVNNNSDYREFGHPIIELLR